METKPVRRFASKVLLRALNLLPRHHDFVLVPKAGPGPTELYAQDGLLAWANHEFMVDPAFQRAYQRGVRAAGWDYKIEWRVHVALWAAAAAARLPGDFVECGVGRGMFSSAILESLPWESLGKRFLLVDTFLPYGVGEDGRQDESAGTNKYYAESVRAVAENFREWPRTDLVEGRIPEVLDEIDVQDLAYLHLDLNAADAERQALEFFWPRLVPGGLVLLDDYGCDIYRAQKLSTDEFAAAVGVEILSMATGQGLLVKPPGGRRT